MGERTGGEPVAVGRVDDDRLESARPLDRVVAVDEQAATAVPHCRRQATDRGRDDRRTGRLRLDGDQAERLVVGGHGDEGGSGVPAGELVLGHRRHEPHHVVDAELVGEVGERGRPLEATAGRSADDRDHESAAQLGPEPQQLRGRVKEYVGGLERLDPAGEQEHQRVSRDAARRAGGGLVLRPEDGHVDAGVDDLDPGGLGVVEVDQLLGLEIGVGDEHVGGLDHLLLPDHPGRRLRGVALGERFVLDLRHGVHRVHERDAPAVAGKRADLAGEPVVGVDDVVVTERLGRLGPQDLAGEHAELAGQLGLGESLERPGVHVGHVDAVGQPYDGVGQAAGGAGEDVDLDPAGGQPAGYLDDVDVHAARVTGAGLVER